MKDSVQREINSHLEQLGISKKINLLPIADHLDFEGDFCFIVNTIAPKNPKQEGERLSKEIAALNSISDASIAVNDTGKNPIVYLNLKLSDEIKKQHYTDLIKSTCDNLADPKFGEVEDNVGKIAIVEHTSANPISPIHVGNLRNSIQGDTFARMLEKTGYRVFRHYLVNDGGLQIGFTVIGYQMLKEKGVKPAIKFDRWLGQVYAIMNLFYNSQRIKTKFMDKELDRDVYRISSEDLEKITEILESQRSQIELEMKVIEKQITQTKDKKSLKNLKRELAKKKRDITKVVEESKEVVKYYDTSSDLSNRFPDMYHLLHESVKNIDLLQMTADYLYRYEKGEEKEIIDLFREMANWTLESFKWTLRRYGIVFDSFDFETDVTWSNLAEELLVRLSDTEECLIEGKAVRFRYEPKLMKAFMRDLGLKKSDLKIRGNIPDLQLSRSDGTSLYVMKDLAYTIQKFERRKADVVYNVVGEEQALAQFQLLPLLYKLGYHDYAKNLHHYGYEKVNLVGRTMSGRLARYVTSDQFYEESYVRARMAKRASEEARGESSPRSDEEYLEEEKILRAVTLATTRFPLIESSPNKRIHLDLDRELDMKRNSGPFVLYAHARANGILKKIQLKGKADFSILWNNQEVIQMVRHMATYEETLRRAVSEMDPSKLTDWIFKLAQLFMKFYEKNPIMKENDKGAKQAKLHLVLATKNALAKTMETIGIPVTERI